MPTTLAGLAGLAVLDLGLFEVNAGASHPGRVIGIPGFLLRTVDGRRILIDTGFRREYAQDGERAAAEDGLGAFGRLARFGRANLLESQLELFGLAPADIDLLILTHTHIDHVGGLPIFAGRRIVVGRAERALPRPLYFAGRCPFDWPEADYATIATDTEIAPGLRLLSTPGHSPGHLSILAEFAGERRVLIAGDAINRASEFGEGFGGNWDDALTELNAHRLRDMARTTGALLIYGHDPAQWAALPKAPGWLV